MRCHSTGQQSARAATALVKRVHALPQHWSKEYTRCHSTGEDRSLRAAGPGVMRGGERMPI
jgi:hypothetical protein